MSHRADILDHLKEHKSIEFFDALDLYKCKRLEARIHELRQAGYPIRTVMQERDGVRWARYELVTEPKQAEMPF